KLNIKTAERDAVFDYNRKISAWLFYLVHFRLASYDFDNYNELKRIEQEFAKRQYECNISEHHLNLFMHDEEFLEVKKELIISIANYEWILSTAMARVHYLYSKCEVEVEVSEPREKFTIRGRIFEQIEPVLAKYRIDVMEQYKVIAVQHAKFRELIF